MSEIVGKLDNLHTYERELDKMSKKDKQDGKESALKEIVVAVVSSLVVSVIGAGIGIYTTTKINEEKIESINAKLDSIEDSIEKLSESVNENSKTLAAHSALFEYLRPSGQASGTSPKKVVFNSNIFQVTFVSEENKTALPKWDNNETVATDLETNQEYTGQQLRNIPIITYYIEQGREVYFYGQYNENDCWNGLCILNIYENNELVTIFEGVYSNGDLCNYKRISCDGEEGWVYANRTDYDTYTSGETWNYEKTKSFLQEIDTENFEVSRILTVDNFLNGLNEKLTGYYYGNTSEHFYNDDSGDAYIVRYNENGQVRYLYKGGVKEGDEYDSTGYAWILSWGYANDGYHYYIGEFDEDDSYKKDKDFLQPITQEKIEEIINKEEFNCPLTGLMGSDF